MIRLRNLTVSFGSRTLLYHDTSCFPQGELTALVGRNGAGKSTLLRILAGLNQDYTGEILISDSNIRSLSAAQLSRTIAFVSTERTRIPNLRCKDVVAMGRAPYTDWIGRLSDRDLKIVTHSLEAVGMTEYALRTMDTMSDGECQRIMIARALAQDTPIILLDEPTSFLDMPNRYQLVELLASLAHTKNKTIIFSTHELDVAVEMCDNIALIEDSSITLLPADRISEKERRDYLLKSFGLHKLRNIL